LSIGIGKRLSRLNADERMIVKRLTSWLSECKRLLIMGVGNPLRGDDAFGLQAVREMKKHKPQGEVYFVECETVPENFIHVIQEKAPSHILFVDAVEANLPPGSIVFTDLNERGEIAVSTHSIPLSVFSGFLKSVMKVDVMLLGVQAADLSLKEGLSPQVSNAPKKVAYIVKKAIVNSYIARPQEIR
jgi:hydrogenase 3 maturation protease